MIRGRFLLTAPRGTEFIQIHNRVSGSNQECNLQSGYIAASWQRLRHSGLPFGRMPASGSSAGGDRLEGRNRDNRRTVHSAIDLARVCSVLCQAPCCEPCEPFCGCGAADPGDFCVAVL